MEELKKARESINAIDQEMASLFEARMQAVEAVIAYKTAHGMQVLDVSREQEVIARNTSYIHYDTYRKYYEQFIKDVMAISRSYQKACIYQDHIAYAGTKGAFSHIATMKLFPDYHHDAYPTFDDVVAAVESGSASYAVLPFENSYTGEVGENMDFFLHHDIYIHHMYDLKISQNLLGVKGASLQDVKKVYSKDQAISQSKKFLEGRGWELVPYPNTALAAAYVAEANDMTQAAIASKETASIYGLDILCEDINTTSDNTTRFVVISKTPPIKGNRISLVFTTHHERGALAKVMELISNHGFNMESIHSRSIKEKPFAYYFYVEIVGSCTDPKVQDLLDAMKEYCESVKIAGSYEKESRDEK